MNVMDFFRSAPTQQATPQNLPPGQKPTSNMQGTQATQVTAPNGVVPDMTQVGGQNPGTGDSTAASPLDQFSKIWETDTTAKPDANASPFAGLDPKKLQEVAGKMNFQTAVTPEILAKIQAGGAGAVEATLQAMNAMAQNVYAQSAIATTKIVEQGMNHQRTQLTTQLPGMVKGLNLSDSLATANPILASPAVSPIAEALKTVLIQKNPNATAGEIEQQMTGYFDALAKSLGPKVDAQKQQGTQEDDWSKFFAS
jgi:hypothetical protein